MVAIARASASLRTREVSSHGATARTQRKRFLEATRHLI